MLTFVVKITINAHIGQKAESDNSGYDGEDDDKMNRKMMKDTLGKRRRGAHVENSLNVNSDLRFQKLASI